MEIILFFSLPPLSSPKFLGVVVDNKLTFTNHVDYIILKCSQRLYLMSLLKHMAMGSEALKTFYVANIKSLFAHACPAWYNLLSDTDKTRLERIQRSATRIMLPFSDDYEHRLDNLALPTISTFLHISCSEHFTKIAYDDHHPLNSWIKINTNRRSARIFLPLCFYSLLSIHIRRDIRNVLGNKQTSTSSIKLCGIEHQVPIYW